jgi:hypothetical protein
MNECEFAHGPASGVTARIGKGGGATPRGNAKIGCHVAFQRVSVVSLPSKAGSKKAGASSLKLWCDGNLVRASNERRTWPPAVNLGPGKSHHDLALGKVGV